MMEINSYAVFDRKAEAYLQPFFVETDGLALRAFAANCEDPNSQFNRYPEDFYLFKLGTWNRETGAFENEEAPISLGNALGHVAPRPTGLPSAATGLDLEEVASDAS